MASLSIGDDALIWISSWNTITPANGTRPSLVHLRPASQNPRDRILGMCLSIGRAP
jgi:hypothetical protein